MRLPFRRPISPYFLPRAISAVALLTMLAAIPCLARTGDAPAPVVAQASPVRTAPTAGPTGKASQEDMIKQLQLFGEVFDRVREEYVDDVSNKQLAENAMNGMLTALDPHSGYLNRKDFDDMKVVTTGEFGGLGIEVTLDDNKLIKVISPIDDTPAAKAGLQPGDLITHIDSKLVTEMTLNEAVDKMRGKPGSEVTLTIRSGSIAGEPKDVKIKRDIIKIVSVRSRVINDVGYIRITTFNENTTSGLEKAIRDINDKINGKNGGGKLIGYVLDLRNNPGGLLDKSIDVAGMFLPDGAEVVSTRGRNEQDNSRFFASGGDKVGGKPVAVLINSGSASASEIVAGALQDYKRGIVLGTKSFGKGSVQTIIPVNEEAAIRITTARYYTPSGRSIQNLGIEPDIIVEPAKVEAVDLGKTVHESDLRNTLKNDQIKEEKKLPQDAGKEPVPGTENTAPTQPLQKGGLGKDDDPTKDYQLMRAIDLLRGVSIYGMRAPDNKATAAAAN